MRPFNKKEIPPFEVVIEKLVFEGKALARLDDGRVCFIVGDCLPGERVFVQVIKKRRDYMEAQVLKRLSDSPDRVPAPCQYFGTCGGCFLQNLSYEKQLITKRDYVQEVFDKIMRNNVPSLLPIVGSPMEFRYRHKILLNFYVEDDGSLALGYYHKGSWFRVIDVVDCFLFDERLTSVLQIVREWARENNLTAFHHRHLRGFLRNITIRHSISYDEWMFGVVTTDEEFNNVIWSDLLDRLSGVINLKSFYWRMVRVKRDRGESHHDTLVWGDSFITERVANIDFRVRFEDFFQNNVAQATALVEYVLKSLDGCDISKSSCILDLYCGVGTFTLPLAAHYGARVYGVELVSSAIDSARDNALRNKITGIEFLCKNVDSIIDDLFTENTYDAVVVDPPRAGLGNKVVFGLLEAKPSVIVYISCNSATMARDLVGLQLSYDISELKAFDLFPQTYHAECVAILKLREE